LQLVDDQEYRSNFPAFIVNGSPADDNLEAWHSNQSRLPETRYRGSNRSRYMNAELDAAIVRYQTTIPFGPRMEAAREITRHVTENLPAARDGEPAHSAALLRQLAGGGQPAHHQHRRRPERCPGPLECAPMGPVEPVVTRAAASGAGTGKRFGSSAPRRYPRGRTAQMTALTAGLAASCAPPYSSSMYSLSSIARRMLVSHSSNGLMKLTAGSWPTSRL
jgi:hypothetical protein